MTYGVTTTTSPATSAVFQPSQNSAPESKAKTGTVQSVPHAVFSNAGFVHDVDTVPFIPRAEHSKTVTSLSDRKAENLLLALHSNKTKADSVSDSEITDADWALAKGLVEAKMQYRREADQLAKALENHYLHSNKTKADSVSDSEVTDSEWALAKGLVEAKMQYRRGADQLAEALENHYRSSLA
ncbi:hypothetical protein [Endozoicomonas sp. 8E]|uniref:hypothetical protein n=1 Tax=Endozoicomonas sp. 8E TaxID=3035692 RepID=UPI002938E521|nr:hypothetical protein [Endozoicomonas sp. 8E]WOG27716.1 hypothetical protein P6910_24735 [Endozoicomonas sp. 8E]